MIIFIALLLTIFFVICSKSNKLALGILLASLPLYVIRFSLFSIPSTLLEGMILILFGVWFFENYKSLIVNIRNKIVNVESKSLIRRYPFDIEMVLVLVAAFIAMGVGGLTNSAMGIYKAYFFEPLLVYILIYNIFLKASVRDNRIDYLSFFKKIIVPLTVASLIVSIISIYQKVTGNFIPNEFWAASETRRVTSLFGYPNAVALFLAPLVLLQFAYLFALKQKYMSLHCDRVKCENWSLLNLDWLKKMKPRDKLSFIFIKTAALLSLLSIYFARSEGALIAIAISIALSLLFLKPLGTKSVVRKLILSFGILLVLLIIFVAPLKSIFIDRINLNDFSGQIRKAQWSETAIMLRDGDWFWGAGLNGYQKALEPYHQNGIYIRNHDANFDELIEASPEYQKLHWQPLEIFMYPHNIFLNFWVELGLFGLLIFFFLIIKFLYLVISYLEKESDLQTRYLLLGIFGAMMVIVIHGIVDVPYFKNDLSVLFWLIISLLGAYKISKRD